MLNILDMNETINDCTTYSFVSVELKNLKKHVCGWLYVYSLCVCLLCGGLNIFFNNNLFLPNPLTR